MTFRRRVLTSSVSGLADRALTDIGFAQGLEEPELLSGEFPLVRIARHAMATTFEIAMPCGSHPDPVAAGTAGLDLVDQLEDQLTVYRDHSEVSLLNATAARAPVTVEPNLFELFSRCAAWTIDTEGAFDIASGALIKAWGFYGRAGRVPTPGERREALANSGFRHVILSSASQAVKFVRQGVELNLGAVGKGYALDRVALFLREQWGVASALLHAGGSSVYAIGQPPWERRGWPIRLQHPFHPEQALGTIWLQNQGLGTSAATYQFFLYKNKQLGHLLDPRTGWPAAGTAAASVTASTAAEADAYSTATFVLGSARTEKLALRKPNMGFVLLSHSAADETPVKCPTDLPELRTFNLTPESYSPPE